MSENKYSHRSKIHSTLKSIEKSVLTWVNDVLAKKNMEPVELLHSMHDTAWSVVAKVNHEKGSWYFKALAPHIGYEIEVTDKLSTLYSDVSASVIAVDKVKRFILVDDLGTNLFEYQPQSRCFSLWKHALTDYAELQVKVSQKGQDEFSFLPDRRLENIPTESLSIIEKCVGIQPREGEKAILQTDVDWIRNYFQQWQSVVDDINKLSIPNSLHHGDLHGGNIAMTDKPIIFDWGDSSWSHPFVTFFISADACTHHLGLKDEASYAELQEAYLQPWLGFGEMDQLKVTLEKVNKVSPLVMLLSWAYAISNKADPRTEEWESGLCTWVNEFLRLNRES